MGRRASSSLNPAAIIGIVVAAVVLVAGAFLVLGKKPKGFSAPKAPVADFYDGSNALSGNEYTIEGTVSELFPRDKGLGLSVLVEHEGEQRPIFLFVPNDARTINIDRDVKYAFLVDVDKKGVPVASSVKRL